jgi:Fe2+ or Zn2+ uptake regulation protein
MEDGLESSRFTLYEFDKIIAKKKELDNLASNSGFLYTHTQEDHKIIIIANKDKAIEFSKTNNCFVEIFTEKEKFVYITTNCFYNNGIFIANK